MDIAHKMLEAGATVIVGAHPHVLQPMETYKTQDGRDTLIFYSLGNFLSNQSRSYVDGLNPDSNGDPRDEMIGLFSAVKRDYGPAGVREPRSPFPSTGEGSIALPLPADPRCLNFGETILRMPQFR